MWYRPLDAALVRATTFPGSQIPGVWPDAEGEPDVEQWCAWLTEVWAQRPIADAATVASPALATRVAQVSRGYRPSTRQARRMALSLARYLVRAHRRATPFALFAGVAPLHFGPETKALWSDKHHVRVRADTVWLTGVISQLEACAALRHRLPVTVNDLAFTRGERLIVPWQPHAGAPDRPPTAEVSVRSNRAVEIVLQAAASPIPGGDLLKELVTALPDTPRPALEAVVSDLITCGVLITSLRPPSTSTDGLAHVVDQLSAVNAVEVREAAPLIEQLLAIHTALEAHEAAASAELSAGRMRRLSDTEQPLMLDVRLGSTVVLPPAVAAEVAHAADTFLRLTPYPGGHPAWKDYHDRFLARYGVGAVARLDELIDPMTGIGFPAHYGDPEQEKIRGVMSRRDERLLALAQQAALDGVREVVLDDDLVNALTTEEAGELRPAPHAALCVEVCAPTLAALKQGAFTLVVVGAGRTAVALNGRFLDLMPERDRQRMLGVFCGLPVSVDGAIPAQLSFPPVHPRVENVACAPRLLPDIITVAEHRAEGPGRLPLKDLAVTADADGMYLMSLSRRRVVEPVLGNAAARHTMPPIVRFLFELPRARQSALSPFLWGTADCLPYLPRIRVGRTVLAPERWRIPAGALPGPDASGPVWAVVMSTLRERLRLPTTVSIGESDRVLRLNLDEPMDLAVLRDHLDKATRAGQSVNVSEAPAAAEHGWFGGRAHEVVVPIASTAPPSRAPAIVHISGPLPMVDPADGVLPGDVVLFAKVYGHPEVFDTILTRHLPELLAAGDTSPMWWFIRYRDPRPHLRLRLHLASAHDYGTAAARVGVWAADLRRRGLAADLVLDTYRPETTRYGSGTAQTAAEALFAADSAAALVQLQALAVRDVHPDALTAASMADLACALAGGIPAGMRWLIDHTRTGPAPALDRALVRQTIDLAGLSADSAALEESELAGRITDIWGARREAATIYTERLGADATHLTAASVTGSLLHMHHIRARGINPGTERLCHRLARAAALSWIARHDTPEGQQR
ncbi:lantibiotic dehydratase [Actinoallomurus liliacearum]|uniref:Lantibiotic dehydratase n=2 Tax=Actinoallomurus liliacearum TaxID=1080073 RepID=A0ABP8TP23_9ACTN